MEVPWAGHAGRESREMLTILQRHCALSLVGEPIMSAPALDDALAVCI